MPEGTTTPAPQTQEPPNPPDAPTSPEQSAPTGDATGPNGGEERRYSKAELEDIVKTRLTREREKNEQRVQQEREAAEAQRLEANKEFQELAEKRQKRIEALEPLALKVDRYEAALTSLLNEEMKQVPEYLHSILEKLDVAERLEWVASHRAEISAKAQPAANGTPLVPVGATPRPDNGGTVLNAERERLRRDTERRARIGH